MFLEMYNQPDVVDLIVALVTVHYLWGSCNSLQKNNWASTQSVVDFV